ncbi:ABC transporter ATP-binding protein [Streptomyces sp. WI04-05B]|uniref:ABC transporter ATP-binding protein n=1 Tax=Streptomyces TaxID=1883 RepID=UPI0029B8A26A|nr:MULTISPECIES: ABC transporter ATP-binding protein [unclassified Streptomyces]MDX2541435.1 ABC transporter ATP-binding protein [Streptomyces sp. WI04-05B]MDX2583831.1 ABC transporter ATP-binding protein [Streptomyces sp. WI04-05A]MDX3745614.1 ABC transporter ATP-binding protein [Streptomyces sp. AK08-02]
MRDTGPPLIEARALSAGYGTQPVVRELDLEVRPGEVVALLGPNGAGKTTTLRALSGDLAPMSGDVRWLGDTSRAPLHRRARQGLAYVGERAVFTRLDTADNLRVGRVATGPALALFPELEKRLKTGAGMLSGGEQQMLSLARALGRAPKLLLADELSLGLAPLVVDRLLRAVREAADRGLGALLVEQHVRKVLDIADRVYVLHRGRVTMTGTPGELRGELAAIESSYLAGTAAADRTRLAVRTDLADKTTVPTD